MGNYLYMSESPDARYNLALDEWFLDHVKPDDLVLYFYVNENAVIIGKNQNPWKECNLAAMDADGVQLVRRISGGGAVYHDTGNLNFSFNAGEKRYDKEKQHRLILEAVRSLGIECSFSGRNDLLAGGRKFSGNAYCSREGRFQHHGTLLISSNLGKLQNYLHADPRKMRSKGVDSVRSRVCNLNEFRPELTVEQMKKVIPEAVKQIYGDFEPFVFDERAKKELEIYFKKQSSEEWRMGCTPKFDVEIDERLSFGGIQLLLTQEGGRVVKAKIFTDANDSALPEKLERLLIGAPFKGEELAQLLERNQTTEFKEIADCLRRCNI